MSQTAKVAVRNSTEIALQGFDRKATFFTFHGIEDNSEHLVLGLGDWQTQTTPLVRLHSECLTGDVFASQKCDCGPQLQESLQKIYHHGGFLVYLRQEGRGIGLYNKLDAYSLQNAGFDTYQSNEMLGFEDDLREYHVAAAMLSAVGVKQLKLLSNNPDKRAQLEAHGLVVEQQVPTGVFCTVHNRGYLQTKADKSGHLIRLTAETNSAKSLRTPGPALKIC